MITKKTMIKLIFSQALQTLLQEKELEEIHTSEIITLSGFSRGTFYNYFRDKYDLANWKLENLLDSLAMQFSSTDGQEEKLKATFLHIHENRTMYMKLFKYNGQNSIADFYMNDSIARAKLAKTACGQKFTKHDEYAIRYHTSAILHLLTEWLFDQEPMTVDEFYEVIRVNRSEYFKRSYMLD